MACPKCGKFKYISDGKRRGEKILICKGCGYKGTEDKFIPKLPSREEVKKALGGMDPPFMPGCSIGKKIDDTPRFTIHPQNNSPEIFIGKNEILLDRFGREIGKNNS